MLLGAHEAEQRPAEVGRADAVLLAAAAGLPAPRDDRDGQPLDRRGDSREAERPVELDRVEAGIEATRDIEVYVPPEAGWLVVA